MELLVASGVGVTTAVGIYLVLRAQTFPVVLGLTFLSYAVNVFLFAAGRLVMGRPPIVSPTAEGSSMVSSDGPLLFAGRCHSGSAQQRNPVE